MCRRLNVPLKIASASKALRVKLQHLFADGLRLVIDTAEHAWQVEKQLRGSFRIRELVLTTSIWQFEDCSTEGPLFFLHANCEKLHTIRVNSEHAAKVEMLYTLDPEDEEDLADMKAGLIDLKADGHFQVVALTW